MEAGLSTNYQEDRLYILYVIINHDFFFTTHYMCIIFERKKNKFLLGLNMFLHVYDYLIQNSWIRKKCIFELKYFPPEVPNFYGFIRFNIFKNHHGEYIDIL